MLWLTRPRALPLTALLLTSALGCGDDNTTPADAPPPDAAVIDAPADAPVDAPPIDAAPPSFSDAGIYQTPVTPGHIQCGIDGLGQACDLATSSCCFNVLGGGDTCPALGANPDAAPSCLFDMTCDGREDCMNGDSCCVRFMGMRIIGRCAASCAAPSTPGCHSASECPDGLACCRLFVNLASSATNFGFCIAPASVPPIGVGQFQCDLR